MEKDSGPMTGRQGRLLRRLRFGDYLIDPRFLRNRRRYVYQCLFVAATMLGVLLALDSFHETVMIAALGASSFIAFAAPGMRRTRPRCMIGGYLVGVFVGCGLSSLVSATGGLISLDEHSVRIVLGAAAIGLSMFLMVVSDTDHPPAAALALGFILNDWQFQTVLVVLGGIVAITVVKELVRDRLIDLI